MKDYFADYFNSLKVNLDYENEISLQIAKDQDTIIPVIKYLGTDKQAGANIISNLKKITHIKQENGKYNLYIGNECFASFTQNPNDSIFLVDANAPQKHLTAFEMRMLARKNIPPKIFQRDEISGMKHSTDLHTHFAGCLSPEDLINIGQEHNLSIPVDILSKANIDISKYKADSKNAIKLTDLSNEDLQKYASSMRIPIERQETFNKMEEVYVMRGPFTKNKALFPHLLRKTAEIHAKTGIKYAEFSLSSVISDMDVLKTIHRELPNIERETGCRIRFLAAMWRHSDKEWNQDEVDRIKSVAKSPYVVGIDFMGHETNSTMDFGDELREIAKWAAVNDPSFVMRVHAGENPLFQDNVKDTLKIVKQATKEAELESHKKLRYPTVRIGHGLYGVDDECLQLCKEMGAIVEFNMASNLSLNNIDNIKEVPLKKYSDQGVNFVLGSDGMGIYSTSPEQDVILAHATGISRDDITKMNAFEESLIQENDNRFREKTRVFNSLVDSGKSFEEIFKPEYNTPDGKERYNDSVYQRKNAEIRKLQDFLNSEITRVGAETSKDKVLGMMSNKIPILITGASVKSWPNISKEQKKEIRTAMQALVNVIDPNKAYIMTGGTNHGVEKQLHEAAYYRNLEKTPKLAVVGTLTEEAAYQDKASIEQNTITHAIVLSLNGKIAKRWFDLPDTVLNVVSENDGEMIAIGGGGIVRDMIQRAHNMHININLMNGPEGASTEKAAIMPEYAFSDAAGLIERIYKKHPDIFVKDFDIKNLQDIITKAKKQWMIKSFSMAETKLKQPESTKQILQNDTHVL